MPGGNNNNNKERRICTHGCVQTLFAINPESKNIVVDNGRSSDLLPY